MITFQRMSNCYFTAAPFILLFSSPNLITDVSAIKIGIIGGGISGTFVSKYLVDYDDSCILEKLTIFDPSPSLGEFSTQESEADRDNQGSRVESYQMSDGRIIELGASIMTDSFRYIIEMADGGDGLKLGLPFVTGMTEDSSIAIYNGEGEVLLNTAKSINNTYYDLAWRYNVDLLKIYRITSTIINRFGMLQDMLNSTANHFFESPMKMWEEVHLDSFVRMSMDQLCDRLWLPPSQLPWWRNFLLKGQGSIRTEFLEAMMLANYNQDNSQINALAGLASFSATTRSPVHNIVGGNVKLVRTAFDQARYDHRAKDCEKNVIQHSIERVATVVGSLEGFEVYTKDGTNLGTYDIMVLATPLAMARVEFLVKSTMDPSILQPMPLGGLIQNDDGPTKIPGDHEGHHTLPRNLPEGATRTYTQVVTTIVRHAELQVSYFHIDPQHSPRAIYMTKLGKTREHNVTSIAQISSSDGVYKVFSSQPLTLTTLQNLFGPAVEVEYEKVWGGGYGGATPDYQGRGDSTNFLLYDGATGFSGHTTGAALYYPNAMELTFACIELSAMGAKAVAKLIAKRLEWIHPPKTNNIGDEF